MAHSDGIAAALGNVELRQKIIDQQSKPLPKIGFVEVAAVDLETNYNAFAAIYEQDRKRNVQWHKIPDNYPPCSDPYMRPVTCRAFTDNLDQEEKFLTLEKLHKIGCMAIFHTHTPFRGAGSLFPPQGCIIIPCIMLEGTNENVEYVRDVEGGAIFCAWLTNRGYATDKEIEDIFGLAYFQEAKKPQIIKKVEDEFGPPVQRIAR